MNGVIVKGLGEKKMNESQDVVYANKHMRMLIINIYLYFRPIQKCKWQLFFLSKRLIEFNLIFIIM